MDFTFLIYTTSKDILKKSGGGQHKSEFLMGIITYGNELDINALLNQPQIIFPFFLELVIDETKLFSARK